jgi:hypothetical protein
VPGGFSRFLDNGDAMAYLFRLNPKRLACPQGSMKVVIKLIRKSADWRSAGDATSTSHCDSLLLPFQLLLIVGSVRGRLLLNGARRHL